MFIDAIFIPSALSVRNRIAAEFQLKNKWLSQGSVFQEGEGGRKLSLNG